MPRYVQVSMPRHEAADLLAELRGIREPDLCMSWGDRERIAARLEAALGGKDLRVKNQHNTHKVKRPRVYLDVRRKSA